MEATITETRAVTSAESVPAAAPTSADPRDPWRQDRALTWLDITTPEQAKMALYGRCAATGRPWVLPTEPLSFRTGNGHDVIDDETFWICQRLLGLGSFVENVRYWSQLNQPFAHERGATSIR